MDPDQTARMHSLVWIHAGRKRITLKFAHHFIPGIELRSPDSHANAFSIKLTGRLGPSASLIAERLKLRIEHYIAGTKRCERCCKLHCPLWTDPIKPSLDYQLCLVLLLSKGSSLFLNFYSYYANDMLVAPDSRVTFILLRERFYVQSLPYLTTGSYTLH
jgi:hypothetical protein